MHQYRHFIAQNVAPAGAAGIGVYDSAGKQVCTIPLGPLSRPAGEPLYSFGLVSDMHLYPVAAVAWHPETKFDGALAFFESMGCAFCAHCGDFTQTGVYLEGNTTTPDLRQFAKYKEICDAHGIPVYGICGNHESILGVPITNNLEELRQYTGTELYYSIERDGDLFLFLGQPAHNKVMGDDALQWLRETLTANAGRRCFVFVHSYIEEDSGDAVDYRENSIFENWGAAKTNAFMELLRQHPNVVLFHGHSHMKYECQAFDHNANYTRRNGFHSVHVPSLGKPRDVDTATGTTPEDDSGSQGCIVEVYPECIVVNGWDFVRGKAVALGTYRIRI